MIVFGRGLQGARMAAFFLVHLLAARSACVD